MAAPMISKTMALPCDGCGQPASTEHIGRRLQRLEWTTRYRPVHIQTLLLGAVSPHADNEFLYAPQGELSGEAGVVLEAANILTNDKSREAAHMEFQRAGFFLTHVLECPFEAQFLAAPELANVLEYQLPAVLTRIRRSLRPKRLVLISAALQAFQEKIANAKLGCSVLLDEGRPFALEGYGAGQTALRLRHALAHGSAA